MGLQNTLYTGMSGLLANQMAIDALANNTANVNATGYKKLTTGFADLLYNFVGGGFGAGQGTGATNPNAIGNGTLVASQTHNFTQGSLENTGRTLDFAIDGNGFFILNGGVNGEYLTRNGNFYLARGLSGQYVDLLSDNGYPVSGYNAVNGVLQQPRTNIILPALDTVMPGFATTTVALTGNVSSQNKAIIGNSIANTEIGGQTKDGTIWLDSAGQPLANSINVGGVQTSASLRDTFGAAASPQTKLIDLTIKNPFGEYEKLFPMPAGATANSREITLTFDRGDYTYTKTFSVTADTTLADLCNWMCGAYGDDNAASMRADSGVLGTYHTPTYSGEFDVAGEQAGAFFSTRNGEMYLNIASNVGTLNYIHDITLSAAAAISTADGKQQNIRNDFTPFTENKIFPNSTAENPAALYEKFTPNPTTLTMQKSEQLIHFVKLEEDNGGTTWRWYAETIGNSKEESPNNSPIGLTSGIVRFDQVGDFVSATDEFGSGINFDFSKLTQTAFADTPVAIGDGYLQGALKTYTSLPDGMIYGTYDNGNTLLLAQLSLAIVTNPMGMTGISGTMFKATPSSGETLYSGIGMLPKNFGSCYSGYLELSNFELGADAIIIQRSYQFSSRLVTTANEMLQTIYNLKQ